MFCVLFVNKLSFYSSLVCFEKKTTLQNNVVFQCGTYKKFISTLADIFDSDLLEYKLS